MKGGFPSSIVALAIALFVRRLEVSKCPSCCWTNSLMCLVSCDGVDKRLSMRLAARRSRAEDSVSVCISANVKSVSGLARFLTQNVTSYTRRGTNMTHSKHNAVVCLHVFAPNTIPGSPAAGVRAPSLPRILLRVYSIGVPRASVVHCYCCCNARQAGRLHST